MTKRIDNTFSNLKEQGRAALVTYIMAYDPDMETSLEIMRGMPQAGADIIELGMPFSDPMAEGPIIQKSAARALAIGCTIKKVINMVHEFRKDNTKTPVILMGYYNPIYHYGLDIFVADAKNAGVDGFIIVDLPPEEEGEFTDMSIPAELSLIKLTAPTTTKKRAEIVLKRSSGFVYYVSIAGITGTKEANIGDVRSKITELRESTDLPIAVGFGIKTPEQVSKMSEVADGVVVGSAFVRLIEENIDNKDKCIESVLSLVSSLSGAITVVDSRISS